MRKIFLAFGCLLFSINNFLYSDQHIYPDMVIEKLVVSDRHSVDGKITVMKDSLFYDDVVLNDNTIIGSKELGFVRASSRSKNLIKIVFPDEKKYMGTAKIFFCAITSLGYFQMFKAKYIFGADLKDPAKKMFIKKVKSKLFDHNGEVFETSNGGEEEETVYARALGLPYEGEEEEWCEEEDGWLLRMDNTIAIRFMPPTKRGANLSDAVVFYEVELFGDLKKIQGESEYQEDLKGVVIK